jgi:hypothetical protein
LNRAIELSGKSSLFRPDMIISTSWLTFSKKYQSNLTVPQHDIKFPGEATMKCRKMILTFLSGIICLFLLTMQMGCLSLSSNYKGLVVPPENLIVIQNEGSHEGKWQTEDISVTYLYTRNVDILKISGLIDFDDSLKGNFDYLNDFDLWIYFVNSENKIAGNIRISPLTAFNQIEAAPFEKKVELPPDTQAIVFSYSGHVSDGGGAGIYNKGEGGIFWSFWKTPHG